MIGQYHHCVQQAFLHLRRTLRLRIIHLACRLRRQQHAPHADTAARQRVASARSRPRASLSCRSRHAWPSAAWLCAMPRNRQRTPMAVLVRWLRRVHLPTLRRRQRTAAGRAVQRRAMPAGVDRWGGACSWRQPHEARPPAGCKVAGGAGWRAGQNQSEKPTDHEDPTHRPPWASRCIVAIAVDAANRSLRCLIRDANPGQRNVRWHSQLRAFTRTTT